MGYILIGLIYSFTSVSAVILSIAGFASLKEFDGFEAFGVGILCTLGLILGLISCYILGKGIVLF